MASEPGIMISTATTAITASDRKEPRSARISVDSGQRLPGSMHSIIGEAGKTRVTDGLKIA
jgi:hypothetical protein